METLPAREGGELTIEHMELIKKAKLTEWEMIVLEAFMHSPAGSNGWKTEVAKSHINPATGKPYSRMAPLVALQRIRVKMKRLVSAA